MAHECGNEASDQAVLHQQRGVLEMRKMGRKKRKMTRGAITAADNVFTRERYCLKTG